MITSSNNQQIKEVQLLLEKSKYRRETGLFVAEGIKMFLEAPLPLVHKIYASEEFMEKSIHAAKAVKLPHEIVSASVFKKMSATSAPQGILMVMKQPSCSAKSLIEKVSKGGRLLVLNKVQDPGNLGTMLRTAEAAGMDGVIMDRGCVDVFNPKVIRSTMGSVYRVPFAVCDELLLVIEEMKKQGIKTVAAHLKGDSIYDNIDYTKAAAVLIGNEGNGLEEAVSEQADIRIKIPMEGKVESLNAAISAALLMYEMKRK